MKTLLFITISVIVVSVNFSFVFGAYGNSMLPNDSLCKGYIAGCILPDSVLNEVSLLPFSESGKDELAPTIKDGYLYYVERGGKRQEYSIFRICLDKTGAILIKDSGQQSTMNNGKEKIDTPENIYLNYSMDGKTLLLNTVNRYSVSKDLFIGAATEEKKGLVAFQYNGKGYSVGRATLSPDGEILVFSSDMPGTLGGIDLWMSTWENGFWSVPQNLGKEINTVADEVMPNFVSNTRLCFASSGHKGLGGYDLFYTEIKNKIFTFPVNMGRSVNTVSDEIGICYSSETDLYYFASNRRGNYDIYSLRTEINTTDSEDNFKEALASGSMKDTLKTEDAYSLKTEVGITGDEHNFEDTLTLNPPEDTLITKEFSEDEALLTSVADNAAKFTEGSPGNGETLPEVFYSIQVMALREPIYSKQRLLEIFGTEDKYFIVRENGWVKYRTGSFSTSEEAKRFAVKRGIKEFFIVKMDSSQIEK